MNVLKKIDLVVVLAFLLLPWNILQAQTLKRSAFLGAV
jgi:hypothetical protein